MTGRPWTWLGGLGLLLMPAGLVTIVLGWYGAAHTPLAVEQTPYVVSGGLLGLGLVVTGGVLFTAAAVASAAQRRSADSERLLAALVARDEEPAYEPLVVTPSGDLVHRAGCAVVAGRADVVVVEPPVTLRGCALCEPVLAC